MSAYLKLMLHKITLFKIITISLCFFILAFILVLNVRVLRYGITTPPEIVNIEPDITYQNITNNPDKYMLIDVRSEAEYATAHASGSLNLPIPYLYDEVNGVKNKKGIEVPKNTDKEIYLICTGGRLAGTAYGFLEHYGYRNIQRVRGGLKAWSEMGVPIVAANVFDKAKNSEIEKLNAGLDNPYAP